MNATDVAAWWGAVAATVAIIWDIIKWSKSGACLEVEVSPNIVVIGGDPRLRDDKKYIRVIVTNTGDQKTTITTLAGEHYSSRWNWKRKKNGTYFVVAVPALGPRLPFVIGPGEQWSGSLNQTPELERQAKKGFLLIGIYHSVSKKPVFRRVSMLEERKGSA